MITEIVVRLNSHLITRVKLSIIVNFITFKKNIINNLFSQGLRTNLTDACEKHDPCQHGGICISTDSGPLCECRNLEYEGTYCERDKAPSEATFRGTEFLSYDLGQTGGEPIVSAQDAISLYFRTRQPNGLLFYTGKSNNILSYSLFIT